MLLLLVLVGMFLLGVALLGVLLMIWWRLGSPSAAGELIERPRSRWSLYG